MAVVLERARSGASRRVALDVGDHATGARDPPLGAISGRRGAPDGRHERASTCKALAVASTVLLCTDGSELARAALERGLMVIGDRDRVVVAMAVEPIQTVDIVGTGVAGGIVSPHEASRTQEARVAAAEQVVAGTASDLGLSGAETVVVYGPAGPALCKLAATLPATAIVIGTRGHGGFAGPCSARCPTT
jgi:nucleotide-binding universal stress UspA family protein